MAEDEITYRSIGVVRTPFDDADAVPRPDTAAVETTGTVVLDEEYEPGLAEIAGFSHLVLLTHLHDVEETVLRCDPPFAEGTTPGIFATRGPNRPNPIGLSIVRLRGIEGHTLSVDHVDLVDGTPLLDIKPFAPKPAEFENLDGGWIEAETDQSFERFRRD